MGNARNYRHKGTAVPEWRTNHALMVRGAALVRENIPQGCKREHASDTLTRRKVNVYRDVWHYVKVMDRPFIVFPSIDWGTIKRMEQ